jgi:YHS domain-containing protein
MVLAVLAATSSTVGQGEPASPDPTPPAPRETKPKTPTDSSPKPALDGYCPVAYFTLGQATKGKPEYQTRFVGETYYFHNAEAKARFDSKPGRDLPQFGGLCTMALGGPYGNRIWGDPKVFDLVDGKLYLFSSERAKRAYEKEKYVCIAVASERFAKPALEGHCPVAYQTRNKALKAGPELRAVYRGWIYNLSSEEAFDLFRAYPAEYVPKYRRYCAEGVSRNKRFPADPEQFMVHNGRTYLFYDVKSKLQFRTHPEKMIKPADEYWKTLALEEPL